MQTPLTQYQTQAEALKQRFLAKPDGVRHALALTQLADQALHTLHRTTPAVKGRYALVAVGGYGRSQLCPHSDLDLLLLHEDLSPEEVEKLACALLYPLWDAKWQTGHRVATIPESLAAAADHWHTRTAMLDARLILGDAELFKQWQIRFTETLVTPHPAAFIAAKLTERDRRHQTVGDARHRVEPNIKEGKGAQRDIDTLWWLARIARDLHNEPELLSSHLFTPQEYRLYRQSRRFLLTLRTMLHYHCGRKEEALSFDRQRAMAEALGFRDRGKERGVERLMQRYFHSARAIGQLTRALCAVLEADPALRPAFEAPGSRLSLPEFDTLKQTPIALFALFRESQRQGLDIHPQSWRLIQEHPELINESLRNDPAANALFLEILLHSSPQCLTLKRMNECGFLGRFIPAFQKLVGQMQFDMYHVYTVDEHTLQAVSQLSAIENGQLADDLPLASSLRLTPSQRRVLYVAMLLHDIAKGRGGGHASKGERIAARLARRFGLTAHEAGEVAWLVKNHLLMSATAFKRDLTDPHSITRFVDQVQKPERLKTLLFLTVADIRAVGPTIWNGWKATLLRELYARAQEAMGGNAADDSRIRAYALRTQLEAHLHRWPAEEREAYLTTPLPAFWLSFPLEKHIKIAAITRESMRENSLFRSKTEQNHERGTTEITLCATSQPGLFFRLAGACALSGASIVGAKSFQLAFDHTICVLDVQTAEGTPFDDPPRLQRLLARMRDALKRRVDELPFTFPAERGLARRRALPITPSIAFDQNASDHCTLIEVTARDRLGLLYHLTQRLAALGLVTISAHISTYGATAVDVFYVQTIFGQKIHDPDHESLIRSSLLDIIDPPAQSLAA